MSTDPRINRYIAQAAPFAQPILEHLRLIVHQACPHTEETIKWGFPHFTYQGKIMCSMAAFKQHCAFGFKDGAQLPDPQGILNPVGKTAMGHLGRITSIKDLPSKKVLQQYIQSAAEWIERGEKKSEVKKVTSKAPALPKEFEAALKKKKKVWAVFSAMAPSHKKEYIQWITEAKKPETRERRMEKAIEMIAEGKNRNWKYEK